jgi:hypothetical protein
MQVAQEQERGFHQGLLGLTFLSSDFIALPGDDTERVGRQTLITTWSFGEDEGEIMNNLDRTLAVVASSLRVVSREIVVASEARP